MQKEIGVSKYYCPDCDCVLYYNDIDETYYCTDCEYEEGADQVEKEQGWG